MACKSCISCWNYHKILVNVEGKNKPENVWAKESVRKYKPMQKEDSITV